MAWQLSRRQALAQRSLPAPEEDIMALRKLGKGDLERLRQMDIPGHESVVEIPRRMVQCFLEVKKDDEDSDV
ncbi:hypothetical protein AB0K53_12390 [Streptomyces tuirus]